MKLLALSRGLSAIVDDDDYDHLRQWKWHVQQGRNTLYASRLIRSADGRKRTIYMHRELIEVPQDRMMDHINRNGLDNRRCNLRLATPSQNNANRAKSLNKTSRFKGVTKVGEGWIGQIQQAGRNIHLGTFDLEIEAARAYDRAAKSFRANFALTNEGLGLLTRDRGARLKSKHMIRTDNSSGITGVDYFKPAKLWRARLQRQGRTITRYAKSREAAVRLRHILEALA